MSRRDCVRSTCQARAVMTLTFDYSQQTAVLGPLSPTPVHGAYDLCHQHAERTSPPVGWEFIRLPELDEAPAVPDSDDLMALADAIREVGLRDDDPRLLPGAGPDRLPLDASVLDGSVVVLAERRHLKVIADR